MRRTGTLLLCGAVLLAILAVTLLVLGVPWASAWVSLFAQFHLWEGLALYLGKPQYTLSHFVWWAFRLKEEYRRGAWRLWRFAFLSFWAWLSFHFLTGGQF